MSELKTDDIPDHHRPVTLGLSPDPVLHTTENLADSYIMFWVEVLRLASQVRSRRAARKQAQNETLLEAQADAV